MYVCVFMWVYMCVFEWVYVWIFEWVSASVLYVVQCTTYTVRVIFILITNFKCRIFSTEKMNGIWKFSFYFAVILVFITFCWFIVDFWVKHTLRISVWVKSANNCLSEVLNEVNILRICNILENYFYINSILRCIIIICMANSKLIWLILNLKSNLSRYI